MTNSWESIQQPPDDVSAGNPWFYVSTYSEFHKGLEALLSELESHRNIVQILGLDFSPYEEEVQRIRGMIDWGKDRINEAQNSPNASIIVTGVTIGSLRYLKAGILYRAFLVDKQKQDFLKTTRIVPKSVLRSFDLRIDQLRNMGEMGKLGGLRPAEVLFELLESLGNDTSQEKSKVEIAIPTATITNDIQIFDPVLRKRCLTILGAIDGAGTPEQFDTVIREMSVVLEDRVRELTGFSGKVSGADLFSATMAREPVLIKFSDERDVQEASHLLFRGYSGLIRNEVMHRLVENYTKDRVIQLLGTVDYLLFLLSKAQVSPSSQPT